jgi:hypothetical protein
MPDIPTPLPEAMRKQWNEAISFEASEYSFTPTMPEWPAFEEYLHWSRHGEEIACELGATQSDIFLNRYYWLSRVAAVRKKMRGEDAGLAQAVFQLIEEAECNGIEIDWSQLEQLASRADDLERST